MKVIKSVCLFLMVFCLITLSTYQGRVHAEVWCIAFRVCGNSTFNPMWHSGPYPSMAACLSSPVCNPY